MAVKRWLLLCCFAQTIGLCLSQLKIKLLQATSDCKDVSDSYDLNADSERLVCVVQKVVA